MQRYRVIILLVLFGVLPVVVAFFFALSYLEEQEQETVQAELAPVVEEPPEPEPPPMREVLAAARALPVGTLIANDDLTTLALAPDAVRADHFAVDDTGADAFAGAPRGHAVREAVAEGAPLLRSAIVGPRQKGFLATVLKPGTRAVTIRVGPATSHAGLIDHGARVDVILTAGLAADGGERSTVARTIVEDVRVVAIDSDPGIGAEPVAAAGQGEDASAGVERTEVERTEIVTATLEASPAQADRLVLGESEGTLSLAVRSLAAAPDADTARESAVDLREILMTSEEFSASEARMKRARELEDIGVRTRIVESKEQLRAAVEGSADRLQAVKVFRGSEPAEELVFKRQ